MIDTAAALAARGRPPAPRLTCRAALVLARGCRAADCDARAGINSFAAVDGDTLLIGAATTGSTRTAQFQSHRPLGLLCLPEKGSVMKRNTQLLLAAVITVVALAVVPLPAAAQSFRSPQRRSS